MSRIVVFSPSILTRYRVADHVVDWSSHRHVGSCRDGEKEARRVERSKMARRADGCVQRNGWPGEHGRGAKASKNPRTHWTQGTASVKRMLDAPDRGCLDVEQSRSSAHGRISARLLMLDGGMRSSLGGHGGHRVLGGSSQTRLNTDFTVAVGSVPDRPSLEAFQQRHGVTWTSHS